MNSTIETLQWLGCVIGRHANKIVSCVYAACSLIVAMKWVELSQEQIGAIGLFTVTILGLFTEANTVSKQRMGERITEENQKIDVKVKEQVDAKVDAIVTGSGMTTAKALGTDTL